MGGYRTILNIYVAWDFEREIEDLNRHSKNGLQLVNAGLFHCKFKKDNSIVYRYQIDFNPNMDNRIEYINAFQEQGWEYINSTFNGWNYFRKEYDDSLSESEYEIYTDRPSKVEMTRRWGKIAIIFSIFLLIFLVINSIKLVIAPQLSQIGLMVYSFTFLILFITGFIKMNKVGNGNRFKRKFHLGAILLVIVLGFTWFTMFSSLKATTKVSMSTTAYEHITDLPNTINVKCPDLYYLSIHSKSEVGITFIMESENFDTVYKISGNDLNVENHRILLRKGIYTIHTIFDNDNLGENHKTVKINYSVE